ncbi:NDP-sugar synthase [Actinomadura keratinilytica]
MGGKGTRLRPLTVRTPKPMVPAAGVPFLTHQLARARAAGVEHVVMATSYLAEVFEPYFGDGSDLGLHLEYVTEEEPLGTGGAIRNVAHRLRSGPDDPVLIFNGDILTGLDIPALVATHQESGADVSLHLSRVEDPRAFGLVPTDEAGRVLAFLEKPQTPEEIVTDQINAGAYVFRRSVIDTIPTGRPVSVERETFPGLLEGGAHLQGMVDSTYWLDLGTPQAFVRGSADLVLGRAPRPPSPAGAANRSSSTEPGSPPTPSSPKAPSSAPAPTSAPAPVSPAPPSSTARTSPRAPSSPTPSSAPGPGSGPAPTSPGRSSATAPTPARTTSCGTDCGSGAMPSCRTAGFGSRPTAETGRGAVGGGPQAQPGFFGLKRRPGCHVAGAAPRPPVTRGLERRPGSLASSAPG